MELAASGKILLFLALSLSAVAAVLSAIGGALTRRTWLPTAGRYCLYAAFGCAAGSAAYLATALGLGLYDIEYVYHYSEWHLPLAFRVCALWAGISGSLLFWSLVLSGAAALAARRLAAAAEREGLKELEPWVYAVLAGVAGVFFAVTWTAEPFRVLPIAARLRLAAHSGVEIDETGSLLDGVGLNQQLVNYWFVVHPPTLYLGFVLWTVPYALAIAALFTRRFGPFWLRRLRAWCVSAWIFLTAGIILGGLWAYRQLGWGGYWAWDPVENASLLPWLTATAALHSILAHERRGRLRLWTVSLVIATFYLTIVATWITRSGVVQSVHAFAGGPVGTWLLAFLFALGAFSLFALAYGMRSLAEARDGESVLSREAFFRFANLLCVLIAAIVFVLSFLPKISHDWFAKTITDPGGAIYYRVVTPFLAALVAIAALGSALNWRGTDLRALARRLAVPASLTGLFAIGLLVVFRPLASSSEGDRAPGGASGTMAFYPTGLFLGLACFLAAVAVQNVVEWILRRKREGSGSLAAALRSLPMRPRYLSAPTAHLGIALLAVGIVVSSAFQVRETHVLALGEYARVGPYLIAPIRKEEFPEPRPGEPYAKVQVLFQVRRARDPLASGPSALGAPSTQPELVADLLAERRYYPKRNQWISEVTIRRGLWEDIYLYFSGGDPEGRIGFAVYLNPFMIFLYLGSALLVAGGIFALVPWRGFDAPSSLGLRGLYRRLRGLLFRARAGFACFLLAAFSSSAGALEAGVVLRARVYDGEASASALMSAFENREAMSESLKVPLRETAVTVELVPLADRATGSAEEPDPGKDSAGAPQGASRAWSATTGPGGELSLQTGLDAFPPGHALVARASLKGKTLYSPFFVPRETGSEAQPVHLYAITESPEALRAELRIAYDLEKGEDPKLVVRVALHLLNFGKDLYVGRRSETGWREIWRLPLPRGAEIFLNRGPERAYSAWKQTEDLRWLVLDAPIPGLCDIDAQGTWEVHYRLRARQHHAQTLPLAVGIDAQRISAWALRGDILLASAQLRERFEGPMQDPFLGKERDFQVLYSGEAFPPGASISVAATVDNAAVGQISVRAALLVGGFVALLATALLLGFWLSPDRRRSREGRSQSAEEFAARVLELVRDFDPASDPGCALLAERVLETAGAFVGKKLRLSFPLIPPEALEILSRLETSEADASPDSKERMRLLEALAESLRGSGPRRSAGRAS